MRSCSEGEDSRTLEERVVRNWLNVVEVLHAVPKVTSKHDIIFQESELMFSLAEGEHEGKSQPTAWNKFHESRIFRLHEDGEELAWHTTWNTCELVSEIKPRCWQKEKERRKCGQRSGSMKKTKEFQKDEKTMEKTAVECHNMEASKRTSRRGLLCNERLLKLRQVGRC